MKSIGKLFWWHKKQTPLTPDEVEFILYCMGHTCAAEPDTKRRTGLLHRSLMLREKLCAPFE